MVYCGMVLNKFSSSCQWNDEEVELLNAIQLVTLFNGLLHLLEYFNYLLHKPIGIFNGSTYVYYD